MEDFTYIRVNSDFKPKNYVSLGFVKIPAFTCRDLNSILVKYDLPNLCQPKLNHLLHGLIKHYLINDEKMDYSVHFGEDTFYRERKFNVEGEFLAYLPEKKEDREKIFADLFWNAKEIYKKCPQDLKKVLELV